MFGGWVCFEDHSPDLLDHIGSSLGIPPTNDVLFLVQNCIFSSFSISGFYIMSIHSTDIKLISIEMSLDL